MVSHCIPDAEAMILKLAEVGVIMEWTNDHFYTCICYGWIQAKTLTYYSWGFFARKFNQ